MTHIEDYSALQGATLVDRDGDKIGKIDEIYEDTQSGRPEWALVNTGLFGTKSTFVPISNADRDGDNVRVPFEKAQVKDAPGIDPDGTLSTSDEQTLYRHYGLDWESHGHDTGSGRFEGGTSGTTGTGDLESDRSGTAGTAGYDSGAAGGLSGTTRDDATTGRGAGHDVSGPNTDDAMTRSEEEMRVGTAREEAGRARLRKYVVTEEESRTVPVQREELRVEREPVTDANRDSALSGPEISEEEHEVVLHEERPVVETQAVPKERVRLGTETVSDEETVSGEVRKERIDVDEGTTDRRS